MPLGSRCNRQRRGNKPQLQKCEKKIGVIGVIFDGLRAAIQNPQTRGQTLTLDSSQRDVPVYVVFLQGVSVGWGHFKVILGAVLGHFEPFAGCTLVPVLLQARAGAPETLRRGAGACQGTNLTAKRCLKAPFCGQIWSTFGKKVPCRAWERVWYSGGSKKSPMSHLGVCGVKTKWWGGPHAWGGTHPWGGGPHACGGSHVF